MRPAISAIVDCIWAIISSGSWGGMMTPRPPEMDTVAAANFGS